MKAPTRREAAALAAGAAEMNREQWWHMLPLRERQRALSVAGVQPERAAQPLATFTDTERERVRLALSGHIAQMQLVAQCMAAHNTNVQGYLH
jgi:DNA-binding CsgD family transcriptional regulator